MPNATRRFAHLANQRAALGTICQKPAIVWQLFCNGHLAKRCAALGLQILANGHQSFGNALPTLAGLPLARPCLGQSVPWPMSASARHCLAKRPCLAKHNAVPWIGLANMPAVLGNAFPTNGRSLAPSEITKTENYPKGRARKVHHPRSHACPAPRGPGRACVRAAAGRPRRNAPADTETNCI